MLLLCDGLCLSPEDGEAVRLKHFSNFVHLWRSFIFLFDQKKVDFLELSYLGLLGMVIQLSEGEPMTTRATGQFFAAAVYQRDLVKPCGFNMMSH